ncbi:ArnT family glycosyltransferase [Candidatus Omnitrophota bacterium]
MKGKERLKELKMALSAKGQISKIIIIFVPLFSVLVLGAALRIYNLNNVNSRSPDERIYTYQARTIAQHGQEGIKLLVNEYNKNKKFWIYPPPTRVGYLWLLATVMKMTNRPDEAAGAYISCFFSISSLILLIAMGLRFFGPWITLYALTFMSVSPMSLAIARRCWTDAMSGCLGLSLVYFCCEITRSTRRIIWYILLILTGSYCILVKESGVVIYVFCIAWILYVLCIKEKSFLKGISLAIFSIIGIGMSIVYLAHAIGGSTEVIKVLLHVKEGALSNIYAIQYQSGPWYRFLKGFWIISPVSASLCLVGIAGAFLFKRPDQKIITSPISNNSRAIFGILCFMFVFVAIAVLTPWGQNLRYLSTMFPPFYLISGLGLWQIIIFAKAKLNNPSFSIVIAISVVALAFSAVGDYNFFKRIFVEGGMQDLSIGFLMEIPR